MLTLRRQEKEPEPSSGLTHWLTSVDPVQQQFAAECLAEMGAMHGTDCLILLASTEDRKRRKIFERQAIIVSSVCFLLLLLFWFVIPANVGAFSASPLWIIVWLSWRRVKASRLHRMAIEKLADGRNPAAIPALVDALWKSDALLRGAAIPGLIRLLPKIEKDVPVSKQQWDRLLAEIDPRWLHCQKTNVNAKLVIAILKAAVAADYLPAADRIKRLEKYGKSLWMDASIRSVAAHCRAKLEEKRLEQTTLLQQSSAGQYP